MEANLRLIYQCDGEDYYDVDVYNETLTEIQRSVLSIDKLKEKVKDFTSTDFDFDDGYLRCNPMIEKIPVNKTLLQKLTVNAKKTVSKPDPDTVYGILSLCAVNGYLILDPSFEDWETGEGSAKAVSVHFSESTMSIYARMHKNGGIYNFMILTHEGKNVLKFHPFFVATDCGTVVVDGCTDLNRTVKINSVEYKLWETKNLGVYDEVPISNCIINQACFKSTVYSGAISVCNDFISTLSECISDRGKVEWAGGFNSYRSDYGVFFTSSLPKLSKRCRSVLEDAVYKAVSSGNSAEEAKVGAIKELECINGCNANTKFAASIFASIAGHEGTVSDKLSFAFSVRNTIEMKKFWVDLYLHRVRTRMFLFELRITSYSNPALFGGKTTEYTNVCTKFY